MLHLHRLLTDRVADRELQDAIIASGLVNLSGREGCWKPIDVALEHINASYAIDIKMHKNSTHDIQKTFGRYALVSTYASALRDLIEHTFGELTRSGHSEKDSSQGVFNLAAHLCSEALSIVDKDCSGSQRFASADVITKGLGVLPDKIMAFNEAIRNNIEPRGEPGTATEMELWNDDTAMSTFVDEIEDLRESGLEASL